MREFCRRTVEARWFEPWMIALIVFNGVLIGLETSHDIAQAYGKWLMLGNDVILGVFIIEAAELEALAAPVTHDEVLRELERTRTALAQLQRKLEAFPEVERPKRA